MDSLIKSYDMITQLGFTPLQGVTLQSASASPIPLHGVVHRGRWVGMEPSGEVFLTLVLYLARRRVGQQTKSLPYTRHDLQIVC